MKEWEWFQNLFQRIYAELTSPEFWMAIGVAFLKILIIIIVARISVAIVEATVNRVFSKREGGKIPFQQRRLDTLRVLVNNIARYTIYFLTILLVLKQFQIDLQPVLVSAGVVGLAVGFGAQSLVRDIITGFFIIFEDQFAVGDVVSINQFNGTVMEIGLRITKIRSWTGEVHIIPNGRITEVTNFSVQNTLAVVDVSVAYEEDLNHVQNVLQEIVNEAARGDENVVGEPQVLGVQALGASEVIIRVIAECKPNTHHAVNRKWKALIKEEFAKRGIEIPYPKTVTTMISKTAHQA